MIRLSSSGFKTPEEAKKPYGSVLGSAVGLEPWGCALPLMLLFFLLQEDNKNYLTLVEKYGDGMLVCGTGACAPTCWNLVCYGHLRWDQSRALAVLFHPVSIRKMGPRSPLLLRVL